ncbi:PstS family phosphate ABC transporter substrate-binding protein [Virgibacillus ihumii]|uniref:PstS family phosphate ABC transporter substrate-binding protein n=1 Tax=Virgibacillus ihumii TaxID=2686091 RepID=UPI00157E1D75|nr:PstS family phosphate ABC transporter substrate-binding protein [Virgibacillus ihumii]
MKKRFLFVTLIVSLTALFLAACGNAEGSGSSNSNNTSSENANASSEDSATVKVDGSSTVFPIMEAVAEEYMIENPNAKVNIGVSGTGGGFEKFIAGETHISNASRPIEKEEKAALKESGIAFTEFKVALDGLSIVVNQENDWVDKLTVEQLKKMWSEKGGVKTWSDLNKEWPDKEIKFFSPGADSGTFDYFSEVVLGEEQIRKDATLSEDDNVLVQGVTGSKHGIGYFGYAYYAENKDQLRAIPIVNSDGKPVLPTMETIQSGEYNPFSRPLFIYVKNDALKNEMVYNFMEYTLKNAGEMAEAVGYVAMTDNAYEDALNKIKELASK